MEISDANAFIALVSAEYERRARLLPEDDDGSGLAYDQWMFTDLPFLHDLCMLYLIALRHYVERRLLYFAARKTGHANKVPWEEFAAARERIAKKGARQRQEEIKRRLQPDACARYKSMEVLRLLANSYKHDPLMEPEKGLIHLLGLDTMRNYMPMPESFALKEGLALFVGLPKDADFAAITRKYVEHAQEFLQDIEAKNVLSPVQGKMVNFATDIGY